MICPRCKEENADKATVCSKCNLKLKSPCPRCKTLNKIGQPVCVKCNLKLIRFCPQCKTPNFPHVEFCRKCKLQLFKKEKPAAQAAQIQSEPQTQAEVKPQPPVQSAELPSFSQTAEEPVKQTKSVISPLRKSEKIFSRAEAHDSIVNMLKTAEQGIVFDLTAPDGAGKSTLVSGVTNSLKDQKFIWLIGLCQPMNQLVPYSFFQDLLKTFFGLPLYTMNAQEMKDNLIKILETNLEIRDAQINNILARILFNDFAGCSDSIIENKEIIYGTMHRFLEELSNKASIAIIIEDIEYIDEVSLECIKYLINKGFINKKNFIFANHQPDFDLHQIFVMESLKNKILTVHFKSMTNEELNMSLQGMLNNQEIIPEKIKNKIFEISRDVPLYMEQVLWYLFQTGAIVSKGNSLAFTPQAANIEVPATLDDLITARIKLINTVAPDATRIILAASLFGIKFIPPFVQIISEVEEQQFNQIIQMLINTGMFVMVDQMNLRFKHSWLWRTVYEKTFTEEQILSYSASLLEVYKKYTPSISSYILARHAEESGLKKETYDLYNRASGECICLGDIGSYSNCLYQLAEMLPESDFSEEQKAIVKINIEEHLGKANYEFNPQVAIENLSGAIAEAEKQNDTVKIIDLTGYMARSCELNGNFSGVLECCDKALSFINDESHPLEQVLLNSYKLESLFNLGRLEETIVQASNEIIPNLNNFIAKNKTIKGISVEELNAIKLDAELTLAKAYVYQGNKLALELTGSIAEKAQKENLTEIQIKSLLLQSLFLAVQGDMKTSNSIIAGLKDKFAEVESPEKLKLQWYFIAIISNLINGNFQQTRDLCSTAMIMAKYFKEYNLLYLIKLILGRCYEELGQVSDTYKIYDEVVNFCSENKMATGALMSWYLASDSEYRNGNYDKALDVSERALEICQKPTINNTIVEVLLNTLICKLRIVKQDFERAQINIENAINAAERNELLVLLIDAYIAAGKINHEIIKVKPSAVKESANKANRLYTKALLLSEQLGNHFQMLRAERELSSLHTFCKNAGVILEKIS